MTLWDGSDYKPSRSRDGLNPSSLQRRSVSWACLSALFSPGRVPWRPRPAGAHWEVGGVYRGVGTVRARISSARRKRLSECDGGRVLPSPQRRARRRR